MLVIILLFHFVHLIYATCPNGSIQSLTDKTLCYFLIKTKTNFMDADQQCVGQFGGNLVSVHDIFENVYLAGEAQKYFTDSTNSDFWIGANNLLVQGKWSWMDESSFDFNDWDKGQPQNESDANCASASLLTSRWSNTNCLNSKPFVCLIKAAVTKSCPDTWTYFNFTKSCYKSFQISSNWNDAEKRCLKEKAHLSSIHSWKENVFLIELSTNNTYHGGTWEDQTWIGASTKDDEKSWQWTDGTPFDYSHWEPGEPSSPGIENCIQIWTAKESDGRASAGEFNDERCQQILPYFICKKLPL